MKMQGYHSMPITGIFVYINTDDCCLNLSHGGERDAISYDSASTETTGDPLSAASQ